MRSTTLVTNKICTNRKLYQLKPAKLSRRDAINLSNFNKVIELLNLARIHNNDDRKRHAKVCPPCLDNHQLSNNKETAENVEPTSE